MGSIEIATPAFGAPAEDEVRYHDIDVFGIPAAEVVSALRALGEFVEEREAGSSFVAPNLLLGLWRDGGPEGPDGEPLYFEAALIAKPGYYETPSAKNSG